MSIANFIPEIWANAVLVRLRKSLVFAGLVNTDYEGEISGAGDTVRINEIGPIDIGSYTKDSNITVQTLDDSGKTLLIDQQKYWAFQIDNVDRAQSRPKLMQSAMDEAAYAAADTIDQHVASKWSDAGVTTASGVALGTTSSAIDLSSGNIIEYIGLCGQGLSEKNVPTQGRWFIMEPWTAQKLEMAQIDKDQSVSSGEVLRNGFYARSLGFDIFVSNNVVNTSSTTYSRAMFGTRLAISHANQVVDIQAFRQELRFNEGVKGLYVYGTKVVRPSALGTLIGTRQNG